METIWELGKTSLACEHVNAHKGGSIWDWCKEWIKKAKMFFSESHTLQRIIELFVIFSWMAIKFKILT